MVEEGSGLQCGADFHFLPSIKIVDKINCAQDCALKSLLIEVGALFQSYLSESVSFAIGDSNSASEVGEAEDIYITLLSLRLSGLACAYNGEIFNT